MPTQAPRTTIKRTRASRRIRAADLRTLETKRPSGSNCAEKRTTRPLRVGLVGAGTNVQAPGGGEIQLVETRRALERLNIAAHYWQPGIDRLDDVDCLHLFGSHQGWLPIVADAQRRGTPVAVSTVAWFDLASRWSETAPLMTRLRGTAGQLARTICPWIPSWRRRLYDAADVLLPNSEAEAEQLTRYFGVPRSKITVVPNGADPDLAKVSPEGFAKRVGGTGFILSAGRIEPRKNQLALIEAMAGSAHQLVVLGDIVPGHEDYAAACRRAAGANVRFEPALSHDDPMLASAFAACGCLVLPSWFETPGLVAIEAAMLGKPLVLTNRGATREYFGKLANYVAPNDRAGIRRAVERALVAGTNPLLADWARQRYTWHAAAQATREAYATIL